MMTDGLPVPPAFVLDARALDLHLAGVARREIERISAEVDLNDAGALHAASTRISDVVCGAALPREVAAQLHDARARWLPPTSLIVRSSAVGEDAAGASFAGQLDSFAGIRTPAELEDAVRRCWASAWSARALFYARARGAALRGVGVVVQTLVEARVSGVLFTVAPGDASGESMLGEVCWGPGDALVGGRVTPGSFVIQRASPSTGVLVSAPDQPAPDSEPVLGAHQLAALGLLGQRLEVLFGAPQDIEWCIDHAGALHVVQSRPITVQLPSSATPQPKASSSRASGRARFSNANVNENFPGPVSPLLYSIARRGYAYYFKTLGTELGISRARIESVAPELEHIVGVHGARLYYNLTNLHSCLRAAPFGDVLTSWFNVFVGVPDGAAEDSSRWRTARGPLETAREIKETAVVVARASRAFATVGRRLPTFEREVDAFAAEAHPDLLAERSDAELERLLRSFLVIRCERWAPAALSDAAAMLSYGALRAVLERALPGSEQSALQNNLLTGFADIVSSTPSERLWELSRLARDREPGFEAAFARFVEEWGFRCSGELMLTTPSFQEDHASLLALVKQFAAQEGPSPVEALRSQAESRRRHVELLMARVSGRPALRVSIRALLDLTHRSIGLRERARLKQALLYVRLRRIALEIGRRFAARGALATRDDVFMLTIDELLEHMAGGAMFPDGLRALASSRRTQHEALARSTPEDSFVIDRGTYLRPVASRADDAPAVGGVLRGTPACGGVVEGRAAVLRDVTEAHELARGEVLVTRQTDPGWGPVLFLAGALVMERGGMLSHGAIIAREFGVPCVVGVAGATALIATGAHVVVDGDAGLVRLAAQAAIEPREGATAQGGVEGRGSIATGSAC